MPDKPKPGKDKDLRTIRQAIEDCHHLFQHFGRLAHSEPVAEELAALTELFFTVTQQLDELSEMSEESAIQPLNVLLLNRQMRATLKQLSEFSKARQLPESQIALLQSIQTLGNQLQSLLVIKEIRGFIPE